MMFHSRLSTSLSAVIKAGSLFRHAIVCPGMAAMPNEHMADKRGAVTINMLCIVVADNYNNMQI